MPNQSKDLLKAVLHALDTQKAVEITPIHVSELTSITDHMVIASGTSNRHVRAIADNLSKQLKSLGFRSTIESDTQDDWVLVDFGDVIVHVMHPRTRDFYNLENLWTPEALSAAQAHNAYA